MRWAILPAAVLTLTACTKPAQDNGIASAGGASSAPATTTTAAGEFDPVKWAKCLREHGITVDDPQPGEGKPKIDESIPEDRVNAAADACRACNPNWGKPPPPPDPEEVAKMRMFAQCMRDHGIDWPDPGPDGRQTPPAPTTRRGGPDPTNALQKCGKRVPGIVVEENGKKDAK
jgi:hypothetical protein